MVNKQGFIVCDCSDCGNIVLNDKVTIYPGYVEVKDNVLTRYDSQDPNNAKRFNVPGILHHRVEYLVAVETEPCTNKKLQGKHFLSRRGMDKYLNLELTAEKN